MVKPINMPRTIDKHDAGSKNIGSWAAAAIDDDDDEDDNDQDDQLKSEITSVQLSPKRRHIPKKHHKSPRKKKRRRSRSASSSDGTQRRVTYQHHNHKQNINQYRPRNPPMHRRIDLLEQTLHRIYDQCHRNHIVVCGIQRSMQQHQQQQQQQLPIQRQSYQNIPWDSNQTTTDTAWK
jgi:hypothetical protein